MRINLREQWRKEASGPSTGRRRTWGRIAFTVFLCVFLFQMALGLMTHALFVGEQYGALRNAARAALVSALQAGDAESPVSSAAAAEMIARTPIKGIVVYTAAGGKVQGYGIAPEPSVTPGEAPPEGRLSFDDKYYDGVFLPNETGHPYIVVARLDAAATSERIAQRAHRVFVFSLVVAIVLSGILLLALDRMLLVPIVRHNDDVIKRFRNEAEDRIYRLAYYDPLTGLPNRIYFLESLSELIRERRKGKSGVIAVISIDIDHFRDINDSMGYDVGDRLLEVVAQRLTEAAPKEAVVARCDGDEFCISLLLTPEGPDSEELSRKLQAAIAAPVEIQQENFLLRAVVGVSHYPQDGEDARTILKNADIALNRAKSEGGSAICCYSRDFDEAVRHRVGVLRDLRQALDKNELQLHYHPQFDLRSGSIVGVEALLRWWKPGAKGEPGKFISPAEFIPVAEQSELIVPIGEYVLRTACKAAKAWQDKGLPPFRVAVNVSGVQFHRSDVVALTETVLRETGLAPQWLELELTESIFVEDIENAISTLEQLRELGVQLALDDFGTGYSSLNYLRRFPIDRLKIDQSFVRNSLVNYNDRMITRTIIALGHVLGFIVIAEGVETYDHEEMLREETCDEVQGFKYSKPLPSDKLEEFVVNYNRQLEESKKVYMVE